MLQRRRGEGVRGSAWLAALIPALVMAVVTCGEGESAPRSTPGGETTPGIVGESTCPEAAPAAGDTCLLPEGTTCAFDACGTAIARCSFGRWRLGGSPPSRAPCPVDPPIAGKSCPPCFAAEVECAYGSESCAVSANRSIARCVTGLWDIATRPCTIPIPDAGADVQRDAGPDSD